MVESRSILSIDNLDQHLDQYPCSTSQSILHRHSDRYLVDTWSTLDQQPMDSRWSVNQLICIDQKLVNSQPTIDRDVDQVLMECQPWCRWRVSIEYRLSVDQVLI